MESTDRDARSYISILEDDIRDAKRKNEALQGSIDQMKAERQQVHK